jgi:hypothetical protein
MRGSQVRILYGPPGILFSMKEKPRGDSWFKRIGIGVGIIGIGTASVAGPKIQEGIDAVGDRMHQIGERMELRPGYGLVTKIERAPSDPNAYAESGERFVLHITMDDGSGDGTLPVTQADIENFEIVDGSRLRLNFAPERQGQERYARIVSILPEAGHEDDPT